MKNYMEVKFAAIPRNEGFARMCAAGFCLQLNPSMEEINDIKTAVSEAVTNCVVHAYPKTPGEVSMRIEIEDGVVQISIADKGIGIKDFAKAREPFYTTKLSEERSGMGFSIMESFMDSVELEKNDEKGLKVILTKSLTESAPTDISC